FLKSGSAPFVRYLFDGILRECTRAHLQHQQIAFAAMDANHADAWLPSDVAKHQGQAGHAAEILTMATRTFHYDCLLISAPVSPCINASKYRCIDVSPCINSIDVSKY